MKTTILFFMTFVLLSSCTKDNPTKAQLPPETQTGANTFGVTINGKVYIPRDPTGGNGVFPSSKGMTLWGTSNYSWSEVEVKDGASTVGFQMIIHFHPLSSTVQIILQQSNFHDNVDSTPFPHIYFKIWDANISNYAYYGSAENQGEVNVTLLDNGIFSGNFKGKFVRYDNPNEFITIKDGRFDINGFTLPNTVFP